jgi:hypothetical protein
MVQIIIAAPLFVRGRDGPAISPQVRTSGSTVASRIRAGKRTVRIPYGREWQQTPHLLAVFLTVLGVAIVFTAMVLKPAMDRMAIPSGE